MDRGDWRLDLGLHADFVGGASQSDVPGEVPELGASLKAIWPACPAAMDCCVSIILKDLEVLSTKKGETTKKTPKAASAQEPAASTEPDAEGSARRKPRFPKKPKAKAADA